MKFVGEMDRNVDRATTLKVVSGNEYGDRKRWDLFVHTLHTLHTLRTLRTLHTLLDVEPPDRNAVTAGRRALP